jgi:PAS domain S-box-containing protein
LVRFDFEKEFLPLWAITVRPHAETATNETNMNEEQLLLQSIKDYAIFRLDPEGYIRSWNEGARHLKGYTAEEIIGKHFSIFYTEQDKKEQKPEKVLITAAKEGKYEEEDWRVRKDGSLFWANVLITRLVDEEGRLVGFAKVTRDLTDRRAAEEKLIRSEQRYRLMATALEKANTELEQSNKELEQFAYVVSHDLKEPLRKISTFSSFLLSGHTQELSPPAQRHLEKIVDASRRMNGMIEDILALSTLSQPREKQRTSLDALLKEVIENLEVRIKEKGATIEYDHLPDLNVIPSQISQLFQNLLANALKFSREGVPPRVHITHNLVHTPPPADPRVEKAEQYLQLRFEDNGIGFKQEEADKIFGLFQRLHPRASYEGSGLGLAICKKVVVNHGGAISAESKPGKGSCFIVTLPYVV